MTKTSPDTEAWVAGVKQRAIADAARARAAGRRAPLHQAAAALREAAAVLEAGADADAAAAVPLLPEPPAADTSRWRGYGLLQMRRQMPGDEIARLQRENKALQRMLAEKRYAARVTEYAARTMGGRCLSVLRTERPGQGGGDT